MKKTFITQFKLPLLTLTASSLILTSACSNKAASTHDNHEDKAASHTGNADKADSAKAAAVKTQEKKSMTTPSTPSNNDIPAPSDVAGKGNKATASGLSYTVLTSSSAADAKSPSATDTVKVHYTGWTTDGKMFDSSVKRGQPASFPLNRVIKGWTEGLQLMKEGEKTRFWIPGNLAYGDTPRRPGAPSGTLVFDVELLDIMEAPKVPKDVAKAPANATTTKSGLAYTVLTKGSGTKKPAATDRVSVHYSGWTTDGKMFDSSVQRGQPAAFPLNGVIKGWTEGLQLMEEGSKYRFWIPGDMAYGENPGGGRPGGTLVFDVELLKIL